VLEQAVQSHTEVSGAMRRVKIRRIAAVLGFFLLWAGVEYCVRYFTEPVRQSWPTIREDRMTVEGSIDTAFVGASLFKDGIIPKVYDRAMGSRSFNFATNSQTMEQSWYALSDLTQANPLKIALIDISVNRLLSDGDDGAYIAKHVTFYHMLSAKARWSLIRDCFSMDDLALIALHSARDQLHFLRGTLSGRLNPEYLRDYLKYAYVPDPKYPAGSMGYTPGFSANPAGGVAMTDYVELPESGAAHGDYGQLERVIQLCREKGITPVLVSMPVTDAFLLYCKPYEALLKPVRELAARDGILCLDFNLSKFRVSSLTTANFSDEKHLNSTGAELFTPLLSEVLQKAMAGEDVSGYFYGSYDAMIRDIDRVATVDFDVLKSPDGLTCRAKSLHGPSVLPVYRFSLLAKGADDYKPLATTDGQCSLAGVEPGVYKVRVEAFSAPASGCDVYAEQFITVE
jgi:hypothetical protein